MIHFFRLGPLLRREGSTFAYVGIDEQGAVLREDAPTDVEGCRALAARAKERPLRCEPTLAEAARALQIEAGPLPEAILPLRATLAYGYQFAPGEAEPAPGVLLRFLEAAARFWRAQPWALVPDHARLEVKVSVGRQGHRGRAHLQGAGDECASLLVEGEAGEVPSAPAEGGTGSAAHGTVIAFVAEPAFARAAVEEAFGLPRLPVVTLTGEGVERAAGSQDLVTAAALLTAIAELGEADRPTVPEGFDAVVGVGALAAAVHVVLSGAPEPEEVRAFESVHLTRREARAAEGAAAPEASPPPAEPPPAETRPGRRAGGGEGTALRERALGASVRLIGRAARGAGRVAAALWRAPRRALAAARRRRPAAPPRKAPTSPPARSAPPPVEAPPSAPTVAAAGPAPEPPSNPFAPFAKLLGLPVPEDPPPLPEEDERREATLAANLVERFAASPPEQASFPAIALQIMDLVASAEADVSRVAGVISRDPALSAGVISVANSPVFRGLSDVETVREAVARLGLQEVGRVAAAVSARDLFNPKLAAERAGSGGRAEALFARSVAVGSAAASAAMRQRGARSDHVYLGGLLHDIGQALALKVLAGMEGGPAPGELEPPRLERILDRAHVAIGTAAHQAWALPKYLALVCAHHHDEEVPADAEHLDLHLVRLTSALASLKDPLFAARAAREIVGSARALHLDPYGVRALHAELASRLRTSAALR